MADFSTYLKPKVSQSNMGERKKENGMFQNIPSYPEFGGFSSAAKAQMPGRPLALEKSNLTRKGKPV